MSAPRALRLLPVLEQQGAGALGHHEPGTRRVERPRRERRIVVLGGEAAHRCEAREDERDQACLGPAREHGVGGAALDHLGGLTDSVRAGCAGRDDGVVRAFDPERDRELPGDRVDEHVRQEVRRDPVGPALAQDVGLLEDPGHAADRRAEDDSDASGVEADRGRRRRAPRGRRRRRAGRCARACVLPWPRRPGSGRSPSPHRRCAPAAHRCRTW